MQNMNWDLKSSHKTDYQNQMSNTMRKTFLHANNNVADYKPEHPGNLISNFVIHFLEHIIAIHVCDADLQDSIEYL